MRKEASAVFFETSAKKDETISELFVALRTYNALIVKGPGGFLLNNKRADDC
jgi:hypothetical protein